MSHLADEHELFDNLINTLKVNCIDKAKTLQMDVRIKIGPNYAKKKIKSNLFAHLNYSQRLYFLGTKVHHLDSFLASIQDIMEILTSLFSHS